MQMTAWMKSYPRYVPMSPLSADKSMNGGCGGVVVVVVVKEGVDRSPDGVQAPRARSVPRR